MITNIEKKIVNTNIENFNKFQIEISSLAIKTMIDLYSNKELAVVRELLTNAWDSHIEASNTDKAIDIEITDDTFRIRDYGTGISEERMYDYCTIYKSSKTNTNSQTGCFGLGSKVPFCIVDNYIVNSYYNGTKLSYLMSIADDFPTFTQLSKTDTDEENGLELIINTDTIKFKDYVAKYYIFSNMKINIISGIDEDNLKHNILFEDNLMKIVLSEFPNKEEFYINYGNNLYRNLEFNSNFNLQRDSYAFKMINILKKYLINTSENDKYFTIIFKIPLSIGLTITPSRELFENTDNNRNKLNSYIYEYLEHKLKRKNIKINNKWEINSNNLINNIIHTLPVKYGYNILEVLTENVKYEDKKPNCYEFIFCNTRVLQKKSLLNNYSGILSYSAYIDKFTGLLQQNTFMYKIVFNNCNIDINNIFYINNGYNFKKKYKIRLLLLNINYNKNDLLLQQLENQIGKSKKLKEHLTLYTNILTIHKDIPFEVIRQFVDFIKIFYDVELHYSKLSTIINKLRIKKITYNKSVGRYKFFVNNKYYKMKEFDMEVQNKNYTLYYTEHNNTIYIDLLHKIKNKFKELPINLQKTLLHDEDIRNFIEDKNYIYIMSSNEYNNLIDYLKNNYNFVDFKYTLYKIMNKIKYYGLYDFSEINSVYVNYFDFSTNIYKKNNLIPFKSKLFSYIYNLYKKRKPTTLIGKNIYKEIMKLKEIYDLYKFMDIYGISKYTYIINYEYLFNDGTTLNEISEIRDKIYKFLRYYKKKNYGTLTKNDFLKLSYRGIL